MDSGDLEREQLETIAKQVRQALLFVESLGGRMKARGFPYDDELRQRVARTQASLHALWMSLHYLACDRVSGRQRVRRGKSAAVFRVQVVLSQLGTLQPQGWERVEAETPLEALAELARQGWLTPADTFWAYVADDELRQVAAVELSRSLTVPHRRRG